MREFNLDLLINKKVVVNCKTKDEANEFLEYIDSKGIKWNSEDSIFEHKHYKYSNYEFSTCFCLEYLGKLQYSPVDFYEKEGYKILSLDDITILKVKNPLNIPKNNFKEYGFSADFEGYIYEFLEPYYIGYIVDKDDNRKLLRIWNKDGLCINTLTTNVTRFKDFHEEQFKLNLIKKEWYKDEENFEKYKGKLITNKYGNVRKIQSIDNLKVSTAEQNMYHDIIRTEEWRPLTKEEINNLIY